MSSKGKGRSKHSIDDDHDELISNASNNVLRKRKFPSVAQQNSVEMSNMFGIDFGKSLKNKRKKLESLADDSLTTIDKKVMEMVQTQQQEKNKVTEGYNKQLSTVLSQLDDDVQKMKEGEETILSMMKQHHKHYQQQRLSLTQQLKTMKQLQEHFMKGLETLDQSHSQRTKNMQDELKQEMVQLRKKILMDSQQKEISTIRRSLQSMLAQVEAREDEE